MKKIYSLIIVLTLSLHVIAQEKELPPEGGTPKSFKLPEKEVVTLDNGLDLIMVPYGSLPKATIRIIVKTGNIHEKENEVWLSDLLADFMQEGSNNLSAIDIDEKIAGMGGNIDMWVRSHNTAIETSVLSNFTSDAVKLLGDVILNPKWPEKELKRLKNNMKRNLSISLSRPGSQARKDFMATMYPNHPYGSAFPTEKQIDDYEVDDIKKFYANNFGAQRTAIYVVGKFNKSAVKNAVRSTFSKWKKGPEDSYPVAQPSTGNKVKIIDRPGAPQSTILYGLPVSDPSKEDFIALDIANSLIGGSFSSRITSNIREDKGYTYSPYSTINANYKSGIWYEYADVTTEFTGASLDEIKKEIYKIQNEAPTKEELNAIKNYEVGSFTLRNSSPRGIISQLNFIDIHDLDDSYLESKVNKIMAITPQQVQELTKKYIRPENMTLIVVGDKQKIEKQIEETINVKTQIKM